MKTTSKILQYVLTTIIFSIPLYAIAFFSLDDSVAENRMLEIVLTSILFLIASHLSLLVMKNKFVQGDQRKIPAIVFVIFALIGIYGFLVETPDIIDFIYAVISYVQTSVFINRRLGSSSSVR